MHIPAGYLTKAAHQRIRQVVERAAKTYRFNFAARNAFVSLAWHIEGEKYTAEVLTKLKAEARRKSGAQEFKRLRDLDDARKKHGKAVREVAYARDLLLRAERNPQLAVPPVAFPPPSSAPLPEEQVWIGSHWTRSTS
ncbi:hypothetical protein [Kitasatospora herbaricolor]|uniref:Transposase n=1 Tax=Kitasatospora herbaricolor TaxID=68217 RepID=A0ABZ1WFK6_9ACTN|nr:hypothetical protein [Kitasatospora herbaricolor]